MKKKVPILFLATLALMALATYVIFIKSGYPLVGIDDANIFFVYAHNFLAHHAFVYQPGGERVEGFSSILWELLCIAAFKFLHAPELGLVLFNIVLTALGLTYLLVFIRTTFATKVIPAAASLFFFLWIFSTPSYILWSTISLMEFGVWSFLQVALIVSILFLTRSMLTARKQFLLCALFVAFVLARPESLLLGLVYLFLLGLVFYFKNGRRIRTAFLSVVPSLCAFVGTTLALTAFRIYYFGFPFPNTYYAKVSGDLFYRFSAGFLYFIKFLYWYPLALWSLLAMAVTAWIVLRRWRMNRTWFAEQETKTTLLQLVVIGIAITVNLLLPVYEGGDHFAEARLFLPIWPLLALPILYFFKLLADITVRKDIRMFDSWFVRGCAMLAFLVLFFYFPPYKWYERPEQYSVSKGIGLAQAERQEGVFLNTFFRDIPRMPTVGVIAAGGIAFSYQGPVADLMGLNDVVMAHQTNNSRIGLAGHAAFDTQTFFTSSHVDVLLPIVADQNTQIDQVEGTLAYANTFFLEDIFDNAEFKQSFTPAIAFNPATKQYLFAYYSNTFLVQMRENGIRVVGDFRPNIVKN